MKLELTDLVRLVTQALARLIAILDCGTRCVLGKHTRRCQGHQGANYASKSFAYFRAVGLLTATARAFARWARTDNSAVQALLACHIRPGQLDAGEHAL